MKIVYQGDFDMSSTELLMDIQLICLYYNTFSSFIVKKL